MNLENSFGGEKAGIKVLDRTALILDIFAQHAKTKEGKLQVRALRVLGLCCAVLYAWSPRPRLTPTAQSQPRRRWSWP